MERQNIDLITALTVRSGYRFNAKLILQITIGWILVFVLTYVIALGLNLHKRKVLIDLEFTQSSLQSQLSTLTRQLALFDNKASQSLGDFAVGSINAIGFYHYLEDLAKFIPEGVWLDNIVFSQSEGEVLLNGNSTTAAGVSAFMDVLSKSSDFSNKKFAALELQKIPKSNNIHFVLSTAAVTNPEAKPETKAEPKLGTKLDLTPNELK